MGPVALRVAEPQETIAGAAAERICARHAAVAVIGLGYVGLPMAVECARRSFPVVGIDTDPARVVQLNAGRSPIRDIPSDVLAPFISKGRIRVSRESAALRGADVVIICVPTPITRHKDPDVSFICQGAEALQPHLAAGQLVILRSTSYPGTTEELIRPVLEGAGFAVGRDIFLAFAPERIDPGNPHYSGSDVPVVIGGSDPTSLRLASLFFSELGFKTVPVSSSTAAEMTKLLENVFRNVNIALVNQMAMLADRMGLDIWEIVDAAASKPYGFMSFKPGLVGGHCIPVDPYFLAWKAREYDFHTDFIELAARVNDAMPYFVVNKVIAALSEHQRGADGASILALGVTFKRDVDDCRHSPGAKVMELLAGRGMQVSYHDPYVPEIVVGGRRYRSVPLSDQALQAADCVVILTDHSSLPYQRIVRLARAIVDTRGATRTQWDGRAGVSEVGRT